MSSKTVLHDLAIKAFNENEVMETMHDWTEEQAVIYGLACLINEYFDESLPKIARTFQHALSMDGERWEFHDALDDLVKFIEEHFK